MNIKKKYSTVRTLYNSVLLHLTGSAFSCFESIVFLKAIIAGKKLTLTKKKTFSLLVLLLQECYRKLLLLRRAYTNTHAGNGRKDKKLLVSKVLQGFV